MGPLLSASFVATACQPYRTIPSCKSSVKDEQCTTIGHCQECEYARVVSEDVLVCWAKPCDPVSLPQSDSKIGFPGSNYLLLDRPELSDPGFTYRTPQSAHHPHKLMMNIASAILGVVYMLLFLLGSDNSYTTLRNLFFNPKSFVVAVYGWWSPIK